MVKPTPNLPVGFRFHPTDQELVAHYLNRKLKANDPSVHRTIPEIDVCKYEPWDIPVAVSASSAIDSDDREWFFFSPRGYKYSNSTRLNRATSRGYWKATGKERKVKVRGTNRTIGSKKTLVFYEGRAAPGVKTNWVIHEYHNLTFPAHQRTYVLCKLKTKPEGKTEGKTYEPDNDESEQSSPMVSKDENPEGHCFSNLDLMIQIPFESDKSMNSDELVNAMIQTPLNLNEFADSTIMSFSNPDLMIQTPFESGKSVNSNELMNAMIQTPLNLNEFADSTIRSFSNPDLMTQTPFESNEFVNSLVQSPLKSDEMVNAMIQTPLNLNEFVDSAIQAPDESYEFLDSSIEAFELDELINSDIQISLKSDKFVNPIIQVPLKSGESVDSTIQTPNESYTNFNSMILTPDESYEFLDLSIATPLKPNEFDFNLPLQLSPSIYEEDYGKWKQ